MLKCPMCRALMTEQTRTCPKCQADVSLLADYVSHLQIGLTQAEAMTKQGELGEAVWAYLAVLEVDPDNATAKRQVGKVATAVRQFDNTAPGRRWLRAMQKRGRFRRWLAEWWGDGGEGGGGGGYGSTLIFVLILFLGVLAGFTAGYHSGQQAAETAASDTKDE